MLQFKTEQIRLFEERRDRNRSESRTRRRRKEKEESVDRKTGKEQEMEVNGDMPLLTKDCRNGNPAQPVQDRELQYIHVRVDQC